MKYSPFFGVMTSFSLSLRAFLTRRNFPAPLRGVYGAICFLIQMFKDGVPCLWSSEVHNMPLLELD